MDAFLLQLHDHLLNLPKDKESRHPLRLAEILRKKNIAVPFQSPGPTEDTKWTFCFEKPANIAVVGSWANNISVKHKDGNPFDIDLAIEMPDVRFHPLL